jgi:hypothetical protein
MGSNAMQLICLRNVPFLDTDSLAPCDAREALFRDRYGFLLYLSKDSSFASNQERVIRVEAREALIWLNEEVPYQGSFWG